MKGWQTRTFTEKICVHHRKTQSGKHSSLKRIFRSGWHDYLMGGNLLWQFFRSIYQMSKSPLVVGGCALLAGYLCALVTRAERPVSRELVKFRSKEQMHRLGRFFRSALTLRQAR